MKKTPLALFLALAAPALAVVPSASSHIDQTANGVTTAFAFTFPVTTSASHVEVLVAGVKQVSGYTVALNANQTSSPGGTVTFTVAPANGLAVRIQRTVPLTQETAYTPYSAFPAKTTERALDRLVYQGQQLQRQRDADLVVQDARDDTQESALAQGAVGGNDTFITATGSTTARSLAARAADVVNVKDFGAVGDGVTDDTAAIQAAITAGGDVVFPAGLFKVTARITLPSGRDTRIRGSGGGTTITRATAGDIFYRSSRGDLTELDGLTFSGSAKAFYYDAQDLPGAPDSGPFGDQRHEYRIRNCRFLQDATDYAIYLYGSREGSIDNCYFQTNKGIYAKWAVNTHVYGNHFKDCVRAIHYDAGSEGLILVGGTALGCTIGLEVAGPVAGVQVSSIMWDYLDVPISLAGVTDAVITGSYISTRTSNPAIMVAAAGANRSQNVKIVGNAGLHTNGDDTGDGNVAVRVEATDHFEIASNTISNWKVNGIEYHDTTYGTIHDNVLRPRATFGANAIAVGTDSATVRIGWNDVDKPTPRALVSADRGDTSQTLTVQLDAPTQRWATTLTANRTVTLSTSGAITGDALRVVRTGLGAFTLTVQTPTPTTIYVLPSSTKSWGDFVFDGSTWVIAAYGTIP